MDSFMIDLSSWLHMWPLSLELHGSNTYVEYSEVRSFRYAQLHLRNNALPHTSVSCAPDAYANDYWSSFIPRLIDR